MKQEPQEDGQAQLPPKAPKTLSSFFCECLPRTSQGRAGKRRVGLAARSSAFPWVRRPDSPLLPCSRPKHGAMPPGEFLGAGGCGKEKGSTVPRFVPQPPGSQLSKKRRKKDLVLRERTRPRGESGSIKRTADETK